MTMQKLSQILSVLLLSASPFAFADSTTPITDTYTKTLGFYVIDHHDDSKEIYLDKFLQNIDLDYEVLFQNNHQVSLQQYLNFENQRLNGITQDTRKAQEKQSHVRFKILDENKDQKLTLKEFQNTGLQAFDRIDKDKNGIINAADDSKKPEKVTHTGQRIVSPLNMPVASDTQKFIERYGKGKDYVTLTDYLAHREQQFMTTDTDHNFIVTEQEYVDEFINRFDKNSKKAYDEYQKTFTEQFYAMSNNKKTLRLKDIKTYAKNLFNYFDKNKDKKLSEDEF